MPNSTEYEPGDDPLTCFTKWHTAMDLVECHHTAKAELEDYRANRRGGEEEHNEEGIDKESIEEQKDEEDIIEEEIEEGNDDDTVEEQEEDDNDSMFIDSEESTETNEDLQTTAILSNDTMYLTSTTP